MNPSEYPGAVCFHIENNNRLIYAPKTKIAVPVPIIAAVQSILDSLQSTCNVISTHDLTSDEQGFIRTTIKSCLDRMCNNPVDENVGLVFNNTAMAAYFNTNDAVTTYEGKKKMNADDFDIMKALKQVGKIAVPAGVGGLLGYMLHDSIKKGIGGNCGGEVTDALVNCFSHDTGLFALGDIGIFFH